MLLAQLTSDLNLTGPCSCRRASGAQFIGIAYPYRSAHITTTLKFLVDSLEWHIFGVLPKGYSVGYKSFSCTMLQRVEGR